MRRSAILLPRSSPRFRRSRRLWFPDLATGDFVDHATDVFAFGLPGTGKTHAMAALVDRIIEEGHSVYFVPT